MAAPVIEPGVVADQLDELIQQRRPLNWVDDETDEGWGS